MSQQRPLTLTLPQTLWDMVYFLMCCTAHILVGSLTFDLVHCLAHRSHRSTWRTLRLLAWAHSAHHRYFDRNLEFNDAFGQQNILLHLFPEMLCHMTGSTVSWMLIRITAPGFAQLGWIDLQFVLVFHTCRSCFVAYNYGHDSNHIAYKWLPKDPNFFLVGPHYHAQHHIEPQRYFGSIIRFVDWMLGTAISFKGRRIAITGSSGALGQALLDQLSLENLKNIRPLRFGTDWTFEDYSGLEPILANTDILILAHGSKDASDALQANCQSVIAIIDLFKRCRLQSKCELMPEVWCIGSEAEFHGSWCESMQHYTDSKRAFVPFARAYYDEKAFIYRHIVPAAFKSQMGPALVTARWAAGVALWWIRRGARYVPVTYTGMAYANYFRFMYWVTPRGELTTQA